MAHVSDEMLREVHRELAHFKQAAGQQSVYAAAHLAGAVEALLEEAELDENSSIADFSAKYCR